MLLFSRRKVGDSELRFDQLERNSRRYKNIFPKIPTCPQDIIDVFKNEIVYEEYALNMRKTHPFYITTEICGLGNIFSVFSSKQIIEMVERHIMPKHRKYLIDGTFKVVY